MYIESSSIPVMGVTLSASSAPDYKVLLDSLSQLVQADKQLTFYKEKHHYDGEITLGGAGEVHLKKALTQLKALCPVPIQTSSLFTCFRETIISDNRNDLRFSKSPNKKNYIYGYAEGILSSVYDLESEVLSPLTPEGLNPLTPEGLDPLTPEGLSSLIPEGLNPLIPEFLVVDMRRLNTSEVRNTWDSFPETNPTNFLINAVKHVPDMNEIKHACQVGFREVCKNGELAGEPLTGIKIVLADAIVAEIPRNRGIGQIYPTMERLIRGLQLFCIPRLVEPFYNIKIRSSPNDVPALLSMVHRRRGHELENLEFVMPVEESHSLVEELQALTNNRAKIEVTFSHWSILHKDPLQPITHAAQLVQSIRKRKRMSEVISPLDRYFDRI